MKIGLIGAENSHSRHFCEVFNREKKYPDFTVSHIYGNDDTEIAAKLSAEYNLIQCDTDDAVIDACDAIVITYRRGSMHHAPAMKTLRKGKHLFNDKPFACDVDQAREIVEYAKTHNLLLCGGSNIKGISGFKELAETIQPGSTVLISYAADPQSEYDGYWFYGIHSAELCLTLCGQDFSSVDVMRNRDMVTAVVGYADRQCIIQTSPTAFDLQLMVTHEGKTIHHQIPLEYESVGPAELVNMLQTGKPPRDYSFYLDACRLISKMDIQ